MKSPVFTGFFYEQLFTTLVCKLWIFKDLQSIAYQIFRSILALSKRPNSQDDNIK